MLAKPRAPFDRWPVEHVDPNFGYAWYCGDGLIVSHIAVTHGTRAAANAYHDFEEATLSRYSRDVERVGGIFVVHDWRALATYEAEARHVWQARMRARTKGYLRGSVVCVARAAPLLRMAVQAANLVASIAHGAKVELSEDIIGVLAKHHATPPAN